MIKNIWSRINVPLIAFLGYAVINSAGVVFGSGPWIYGYLQGPLGPIVWLIFAVQNSTSGFNSYLFSVFLLVSIICLAGILSYVAKPNIFTIVLSIISMGCWFYIGYLPALW